MSEPERPLHVRVAEALGWKVEDHSVYDCRQSCVSSVTDAGAFPCTRGRHDHIRWERWKPYPYDDDGDGNWETVPRYDYDWSETGPLIERFKLDLWHVPEDILGPLRWRATCERADGSEEAATPLGAICKLILALHEAGRLPK